MRPIDADALIAWIKESQQMTSKMKAVICKIKTMPSADRPKGENLLEEYPSLFECSVCGASCFDTIPWDCNINFCPNCGARMIAKDINVHNKKGADDAENNMR